MADYTVDELFEKLERADAAGDAEAAKVIADEIRRIQSQSEAGGGAGDWQEEAERLNQQYQQELLDGMPWYQKLGVGMGRSVAESWRGVKQIGGWAADKIPGVDVSDFRQRTQEEIDDARRADAPLLKTGWGQTGNILGSIMQLYTPGAALKGTALARGFLPSTIKGNALQGALLGTLQPTATGESRVVNALTGAAGGAGGAAAVRAAGAVASAVRGRLAGVSGADREAAGHILGEASGDRAALGAAAPSLTPGRMRTLAEETRDAGVSRLERALRGQSTYDFGALDANNNAAMTQVLERIAGTDADMAAAMAARSQAADVARQSAVSAAPVDISATLSGLDGAIRGARGRQAVMPALQSLRDRIGGYADANNRVDVNTLDNVRQDIGDMLAGKFGGESAAALKGSRELTNVSKALNAEIGSQVPDFTDYLNAYRQMSGPINRMEIGRELLRRSQNTAAADAAGIPILGAAPFVKNVRDLDGLAAAATGFDKAKASNILSPDDIGALGAMQDDFERQIFARTQGTGQGSPTDAFGGVMDRLGSPAMDAVPGGGTIKAVTEMFSRRANERLKERTAYLLANPEEFRRALQALPSRSENALFDALTGLGGAGGAGAAVLGETKQQPLEIDVTGGRVGPAPTEEEMEQLRVEQQRRLRAAGY